MIKKPKTLNQLCSMMQKRLAKFNTTLNNSSISFIRLASLLNDIEDCCKVAERTAKNINLSK
jgi:hypothetical protein